MCSKLFLHKVTCVLLLIATATLLPTTALAAPKYRILHGFTGGKDGGTLFGSLTLDSKGNLYGATWLGTIFELSPRPGGKWHFQVLLALTDGSGPNGGMALDSSGNLYGTTQAGGPYGDGVVFELSHGTDGWKETVLTDFPGGVPAGAPWDGPIMDKAGNLYGTGGSAWELSLGSDGWKLTILHEFTGKSGDGDDPYAGLIMDVSGNLYGTTFYGGITDCGQSVGCGTAYELSPAPGGKWKEHILHKFGKKGDGDFPGQGRLAMDSSGRLYGTTGIGGQIGYGIVFRLTPSSNGHWTETILHNFAGSDGDEPVAGVVIDKAGNLYGTTSVGGPSDCGVVYKLAPGKDDHWTYSIVHSFDGSDGTLPDANLILDDKGNLYGTTALGGPGGYGVAFELTP